MKKQIKTIKCCIELYQNIQLIGADGIGKSFMIKNIVKDNNINNIFINCSVDYDKKELLKQINRQLIQKLYNQNDQKPQFNNLEDFIDYIPELKSKFQKINPENKQFYLILDNFQNLNLSNNIKFFNNLLSLKSITNNQIQLIVIQNSIKQWQYNHNCLNQYSKILMEQINEDQIKEIMKESLIFHYNLDSIYNPSIQDAILEYYVKDIYDNFKIQTKNIKLLKSLANRLFFLIIDQLKLVDIHSLSVIQSQLFGKNRKYQKGKKILQQNPERYLQQQELEQIIEQDEDNECLPDISNLQGLLILACLIANRNPIESDKYLFLNPKVSQQKSVKQSLQRLKEKETNIKQACQLRMQAILSILLYKEEEQDQEDKYEFSSLWLSEQMQSLRNKKYLLGIVKKRQDPSSPLHFLCNLPLDTILHLSHQRNHHLQDYLVKQINSSFD